MSEQKFLLDGAPKYNPDGSVELTGKLVSNIESKIITIKYTVTGASTSVTTPSTQNDKKKQAVEVFKLSDLATVMDKNGWEVAAHLQRLWFASPAAKLPEKLKKDPDWGNSDPKWNFADFGRINKKWLSNFGRVESKQEDLVEKLDNEKGRTAIIKNFIKNKVLTHYSYRTAGFSQKGDALPQLRDVRDCKKLHRDWQSQFVKFDSDIPGKIARYGQAKLLKMDDIWAAFAGCSAYAAIGDYQVNWQPNHTCSISILSIYFYLIDTYEFIGDEQYLGHWNKSGVEVDIAYVKELEDMAKERNISYESIKENRIKGISSVTVGNHGRTPIMKPGFEVPDLYFCVRNKHFNQYRRKTGKGGDKVVWTKPYKVPVKNKTIHVSYQEFSDVFKALRKLKLV